jgi:hypothetical protein
MKVPTKMASRSAEMAIMTTGVNEKTIPESAYHDPLKTSDLNRSE